MSSPTKPTTSIDDLPPEMIYELFKHLSPKDLVVCSIVNKPWHSIYATFKVHRLVSTDYGHYYGYYYELSKWYDSNRRIEEIERCRFAIFHRFAEKPLLSNLKHLALCGYKFEFDLNELNRFSQLVHLEINMDFGRKMVNVHLNLPKLKVLALHHFHTLPQCSLSIDCPQLGTLVYRSGSKDPNLLNVKYPETIRKLDTDLFGSKLAPFKSVECLVTRELRAISKATLLSLPGLKELHYSENIEMAFCQFRGEVGALDRMKRELSEFMGDVEVLGRWSDFQFSFAGFQLTKTMLNEIDFAVRVKEGRERVCNEYVYLENYQLIEPGALHFVHRMDYMQLMRNLTGELPSCFSQKFTGIDVVRAEGVSIRGPDHLLWFLKSLRFLRRLELVDGELGQEFYDQLPASAHSLTSLELRVDWKNELKLNFDFIGKLLCLSNLTIGNPPLSFESATSLTRSLGKLTEGTFRVRSKGKRFSIHKIDSKWMIFTGQLPFKTENPDKIVNFFEGLQAGFDFVHDSSLTFKESLPGRLNRSSSFSREVQNKRRAFLSRSKYRI